MITDEFSDELRSAMTRIAAGIAIPEPARRRLVQRDYHPRKMNRGLLAAGITAILAGAGLAASLTAGAAPPAAAPGPAIRLASYTFRLPAGYRLTAATSAACQTYAIADVPPAGTSGGWDQNLPYAPQMTAAASSSGGCIVLVLAPAYTPTAAVPDPEAPPSAQPVQVASYHGLIANSSVSDGKSGHLMMSATELYVQLPVAGGQIRDLVIGGTNLSAATLISIADQGLSS